MLESVGDEIARHRFVDEIVDRRSRRQKSHRVEQHRRAAIDHMMRLDERAVGSNDAADFWRDQLEDRFLLGDGVDQTLQQLGIDTIGDQNAKLASFEAFRATLDDAERRRRLQILTGRHRRIGRLRYRLEAELLSYRGRQRLVYVEQVGDHPFADDRHFDLAEFECQC